MLQHNELLIPHWNKIAKGAQEIESLESFSIEQIQIHNDVLNMILVPVLQKKHLLSLKCCYNGLGHTELLSLLTFVENSTTLTDLHLDGNQINEFNAVRQFVLTVQRHPTLRKVSLRNCGLGNNTNIFSLILSGCRELRELLLRDNKMSSPCVNNIAAFIASNPCVIDLDLSRSMLSDVDAPVLAGALKKNNTLRRLCLEGNGFSDDGYMLFMAALCDSTSFNTIADSNHSCKIIDDSYESPICGMMHVNESVTEPTDEEKILDEDVILEEEEAIYFKTKAETEMKIKYKILKSFHKSIGGGYYNMEYLQDFPVEVMPHVLQLIQENIRVYQSNGFLHGVAYGTFIEYEEPDKNSLDRLFHVLMNWNMPLLFKGTVDVKTKGITRKRRRIKPKRE